MHKIKNSLFRFLPLLIAAMFLFGCKHLNVLQKQENKSLPNQFADVKDSTSSGKSSWKKFFKDPFLNALIDSALKNNQELNIILQEISIAKNEVFARKGAYLPFLNTSVDAGVDKVSRYSSKGASDAISEIAPGKQTPEVVPIYDFGLTLSWELDIWKKLRNSKKSAVNRYLSTIDGKNFMVTHLISEIANSYYELLALDNQLEIVKQNIVLYQSSLEIVKLEKQSARVTELAVRRFEAEVLKNQSRQFYISQQITQTENNINFLLGRFPQKVNRNPVEFTDLTIDTIQIGTPLQLIETRTDIKQAEHLLAAAKLDVKVARSLFYPTLTLFGGIGYGAFSLKYLPPSPQSLLYNLAGNLAGPLINRNAIKANFYSAGSKQTQAVYNYERVILRAYTEVSTQLSNIRNLKNSYELKSQQVNTLIKSIDISTTLFASARADYMEVLLTQRDALEAKIELVETKKQQLNANINMYRALGGGWQ